MADDYASYVDSELEKIKYTQAINHYKNLKNKFLAEYNSFINQSNGQIIDNELNKIIDEVNKNPVKDQQDTVTKIYTKIRDLIVNQKDNNTDKDIKKFLNSRWKDRKSLAEKDFNTIAQSILSDKEIENFIVTTLNPGGADISNILAAAKRFRDKVLKSRSIQKTAVGNVSKVTGFYREVMIYKSFSTVFQHLEAQGINFSVLHAGDIKFNQRITGQDNITRNMAVDTPYDIYIDFFNNLSKANFQTRVEEDEQGYGIQSKSWLEPWSSTWDPDKHSWIRYHIGSRSNLLAQLRNGELGGMVPYSWLTGVRFLSRHVPEVLGERNVMWASGNELMYTADMITQFRAKQYFIAFEKSKDGPLKASVLWQKNPYWLKK